MFAVDLPRARRFAFAIVAAQAAVSIVVAVIAGLVSGGNAALSALCGGAISTLASLVMAVVAFWRGSTVDAARIARLFYLGEVAKIAVAIALFVVVLKLFKVNLLALFAAYVATFFVYWLALANLLPSFGGRAISSGSR